MTPEEKFQLAIVVSVAGALLTLIRRRGNPDPDAGCGVAVFTLLILAYLATTK